MSITGILHLRSCIFAADTKRLSWTYVSYCSHTSCSSFTVFFMYFLLLRDENLGLKMGAVKSISEPLPGMEPGLVEKEGLEPPGDVELHLVAQEVTSNTM